MRNSMQKGFTLIELMIVIAIIGVLAAVAVPAYQDYISKSQVTAGLAEINPAKIQVESALNTGTLPTDAAARGTNSTTAAHVLAYGITALTSSRCANEIVVNADNSATIQCTLIGSGSINGRVIQMVRTLDNATTGATGTWSCNSNVAAKFAPVGCALTATAI